MGVLNRSRKTEKLTLRLEPEVAAKLDAFAARHGRSRAGAAWWLLVTTLGILGNPTDGEGGQ